MPLRVDYTAVHPDGSLVVDPARCLWACGHACTAECAFFPDHRLHFCKAQCSHTPGHGETHHCSSHMLGPRGPEPIDPATRRRPDSGRDPEGSGPSGPHPPPDGDPTQKGKKRCKPNPRRRALRQKGAWYQ